MMSLFQVPHPALPLREQGRSRGVGRMSYCVCVCSQGQLQECNGFKLHMGLLLQMDGGPAAGSRKD
jgi:hypothetical protein